MSDYIDRLEAELVRVGFHARRRRSRRPAVYAVAALAAAVVLVAVVSGLGDAEIERPVQPPPPAEAPLRPVSAPGGGPDWTVSRERDLICLERPGAERFCASEAQHAAGLMFGSTGQGSGTLYGLVPRAVREIRIGSTRVAVEGRTWTATVPPNQDVEIEAVFADGTVRRPEKLRPVAPREAPAYFAVLRDDATLVDPATSDKGAEVHLVRDDPRLRFSISISDDEFCEFTEFTSGAGSSGCAKEVYAFGNGPGTTVRSGGRVSVRALLPDGTSDVRIYFPADRIEFLPVSDNLAATIISSTADEMTWRAADGTLQRRDLSDSTRVTGGPGSLPDVAATPR